MCKDCGVSGRDCQKRNRAARPANPVDCMVSRQDRLSGAGNSPTMKEAIKEVFDELLAMSDEELQEALENAQDTGLGRMMIESGAHTIFMERGSEGS